MDFYEEKRAFLSNMLLAWETGPQFMVDVRSPEHKLVAIMVYKFDMSMYAEVNLFIVPSLCILPNSTSSRSSLFLRSG